MLTVEPRSAIWADSGAKVETRADVSEPARAIPTNLKFQRTDFVRGPSGARLMVPIYNKRSGRPSPKMSGSNQLHDRTDYEHLGRSSRGVTCRASASVRSRSPV